MRLLGCVIILLSLSGCATYFERKACEKTNWFTHGENVARGGGSLEGDHYLNSCRKVEANIDESKLDLGFKKGRDEYCTPEYVFEIGKRGEKFRTVMCEGGNLKLLGKKYSDGVNQYCAEDNGLPEGTSGRIYQGVCSKTQEAKFLPKYNKGRIKYLKGVVISSESQLDVIDQDIDRLNDKKRDLMLKLSMTPLREQIIYETEIDEHTGQKRSTRKVVQDEASKSARESIEWDMRRVDNEIEAKRTEQKNIKTDIQKRRAEIESLSE